MRPVTERKQVDKQTHHQTQTHTHRNAAPSYSPTLMSSKLTSRRSRSATAKTASTAIWANWRWQRFTLQSTPPLA